MSKKALFLCLSILSANVYAYDKSGNMDYMLGNFSVDGFDTAAEEKYKAKLTVKKTLSNDNKLVIYSVLIGHNKNSGLGTYYGFISDLKNDVVTIDYQNAGKQDHQVTCNYKVDENIPSFSKCTGSWLGNLGGDGEFILVKET